VTGCSSESYERAIEAAVEHSGDRLLDNIEISLW